VTYIITCFRGFTIYEIAEELSAVSSKKRPMIRTQEIYLVQALQEYCSMVDYVHWKDLHYMQDDKAKEGATGGGKKYGWDNVLERMFVLSNRTVRYFLKIYHMKLYMHINNVPKFKYAYHILVF